MHCLINSLTFTLGNRYYFNYLASLHLKTEIILFTWTWAFLVPLFSWNSLFSLIDNTMHLLPPGIFGFGAWVLREDMSTQCVLVVVTHCIDRGHNVSSVLYLGYRILGGICMHLMNFISYFSFNRQYLFLLQLILPERQFIRQSHVHSTNCVPLPLHFQ